MISRVARCKSFSNFKTLFFSLLCFCFASLQNAVAQDDAATARYKAFSAAQKVDDLCHLLGFADRKLLNDQALGSIYKLPIVAASSAAGDDSVTFFKKVGEATKPIEDELNTALEGFDCANAPQLLRNPLLLVYVDMVAHLEKGRAELANSTTNVQKSIAGRIVQQLQQAFANAPQGQLAQIVQQRMNEIERDAKSSAGRAKYMFNLVHMGQILQSQGHDLRWQEDERAWGLFDLRRSIFLPGYVFAEPVFTQRFKVQEGENSWDHQYSSEQVMALIGRENASLMAIALPADPRQKLSDTSMMIAMGDGLGYIRYRDQGSDRCPVGLCFSFSTDTKRIIERFRGNGAFERPDIALYETKDLLDKMGPQSMREKIGLAKTPTYTIPINTIFPRNTQ